MNCKRLVITNLLLLLFSSTYAQVPTTITESLGNVKLIFTMNDKGEARYAVQYKENRVIDNSRLGFVLIKRDSLIKNFSLLDISETNVDEAWKPVWGEVKSIRNHYKQLIVRLQEKQDAHRLLNIVFRVFEDGIGFRYEFPSQPNLKYFIIADELTQFNLTGDHKTFWIPGDYDSNEYTYTTSKLSEVDAWKLPLISFGTVALSEPDRYAVQTPLMMKTTNGLYINIHEAALKNYPSMQLHVDRTSYSLSSNLVPDALGYKAYLRTPAKTPWRTIIISDDARDILASKMILNLNEPSVIKDASWIRPMKFIGVWWEMQTGRSTWYYTNNIDTLDAKGNLIPGGHHGATTANVKRYIDFASANGIKGLLVEGWNTGWEEWFGNWSEDHFDFVTPYPDFDVREISRYAKEKGVEMIMHNETSGGATSYERQMDTAFRFMNKFGYKSVKTGYVGQIIPRGEHHDGQWMVNHYIRAATKAAQYKVMIDMHEPVRPTGLSRTYPNWLASEAGRGNEWNAFSEGNSPEHETIMPFTRLMGGPMDYTPGIFKLRGYSKDAPTRHMHTTLAKQLALYVTMYSPLQMAADLPENYLAHLDAFQFIKDVPVDWDDTKILEAEPGMYITIARKEKGSSNWFIGAISNELARISTIKVDFLENGKKYIADVYEDGDNAHWENNPESYHIRHLTINNKSILNLKLAPGGGAAICIRLLK